MSSHHILQTMRALWPDIAGVLNTPWKTPQALAREIRMHLQSVPCWTQGEDLRVDVAGAPDHHLLCLLLERQVIVCNPRQEQSLTAHPFVRELREQYHARFAEQALCAPGDCLIAPLSARLKARLTLPSVLLVSLFHPEMYPATRLTLGIASLASYVRLRHLARVEIMDSQFDIGVRDILERVSVARPDILGVSVNFGQFDLMEQLLDGIYASEREPPAVILGNILPAMCFQEILQVYPDVLICRKEGELSLAELVSCGRDRSRLSQVPGIWYRNEQGRLISTPPAYLPMEQLPPPAFDTIEELFRRDGVITAEFSRGCQYNRCSFCPRSHKGSIWRTVPVATMLQQWEIFARIFRHFQRTPHVFLADEDFIGKEEGDATIQRISDFCAGVRAQDLRIPFDASCRADQIFQEKRDRAWHVQRGKLLRTCVDSGLSRLFLGVESGASAQLVRYNKGSSVQELVSAIRYLSLLGVRLRFGFIFFDPLMSAQDLRENIEFLGRTDVILPEQSGAPIEEIFALVLAHHQQVLSGVRGQAVFNQVSYMVSPLEVLAKSRYLFEIREQAPHLISEQLDVSFARYQATYALSEIQHIWRACQSWVQYCFPIVYALKGLQKVSQGEEYALLWQAITAHRSLSYLLIRSLAQIFSLVDSATVARWEQMHPGICGERDLCCAARQQIQEGQVQEAIRALLLWYEKQMQAIVDTVQMQTPLLSIPKQRIWRSAYHTWARESVTTVRAQRTI
jgi:hypothetical protein